MMLSLLNGNPLQWTPLHQITQTQLQFLPRNLLVSNGNIMNLQTVFCSSSSAASNLQHESPEMKDPILDFFHSYGFADTQIERFIHKCPSVRSIEMIKPKLEHLLAFGFSPSELIRMISSDPSVLVTSLKERIVPNLKLLEQIIGSKTHTIKAIARSPWFIRNDLESLVIPNVEILKENNVPMENIAIIFLKFPLVLCRRPDVFTETVSKLLDLGMRPSSTTFIYGVIAMAGLKKETWERKMKLYQSFGWSEKDTLSAFSRHPRCMQISDEKIKKQMEFFTVKLRWDSAMVVRWPIVLSYSLEGRIIPRCSLLNVLAKNGLWNGKPKLLTALTMREKDFEERFVKRYGKEVLQVIEAYQGKVEFVGFDSKRLSQSDGE